MNTNRTRSRRLLFALLATSLSVGQLASGCAEIVPNDGQCPRGFARGDQRTCVATHGADADRDEFDAEVGASSPLDSESPVDAVAGSPAEGLDADKDSDVHETEEPPPSCDPGVSEVYFSEVFANPAGQDRDGEFIELVVSGDQLEGAKLLAFNGDDANAYWHTRFSEELADGQALTERRLLFSDEYADAFPTACDAASGCLQNGPDRLEVHDCSGALLALIDYPSAASGRSFALCEEPLADDYGLWGEVTPSPGYPGNGGDAEFCALPCDVSLSFDVQIEQLLVNPAGPDSGKEFVVLSGPPDAEADTLSIRGTDGITGDSWLLQELSGESFDTAGRLAIVGRAIEYDGATLGDSLQNGPDALSLFVCNTVLVETVRWEPPSGDASSEAESTSIPIPASNELWLRCPGGFVAVSSQESWSPLGPEAQREACLRSAVD